MSRFAALAVLALVMPALAGCASQKETPAAQSLDGGRVGGGTSAATGASSASSVAAEPPPISGTSARWHFHDYWHGKPTIVLMDTHVNLSATPSGLGALVALPQGVIVPPETGFLTVNISWAEPANGAVNVTYRPGDSNDFYLTKDAASGHAVFIGTTESMCDVPHRQQSLWAFNLTARPSSDVPPGVPNTDLHVIVSATIGRPLFIDPPHFNWWQGSEIIDLVQTVRGDLGTAATPAGNATAPDPAKLVGMGVPPRQDQVAAYASDINRTARVPVTPGRIVPEGAVTLVGILNWTAQTAGMPKLKVTYEEKNNPSSGDLPVVTDGDASRIFVLRIAPPQTDTTYSNRTTWQFHVVPDGDEAAFKGSYVFTAWVTRLSPEAAVKGVTSPPEPQR